MLMIMKKEQMELKEVIKVAILEAFAELYGAAPTDAVIPEAPGAGDGEASDGSGEGSEGNSNNGGGSNSAANSGGTPGTNKPKPNVGVGTFDLR